jgi:hypothetical protein
MKYTVDRRWNMRRKYFFNILILEIAILFFSCETFQEIVASLENSISETTSSNTTSRSSGTPLSTSRNDPNRRADPDASNWDIALLDTAANVDYLTGIEKDVILEMNKVRTDPKKYAQLYIQPRLRYYSGKNYSVPGQITIVTQEGTTAVNGCITALNRANRNCVIITCSIIFFVPCSSNSKKAEFE